MSYICRTYKVPARRGDRVIAYGKPGVIVGARGQYLRIRLDGERRSGCYHPTSEIEYLQRPAAINPAAAFISTCITRHESLEAEPGEGAAPDDWEHDGGRIIRMRFGDRWYRITVARERARAGAPRDDA